MVKNPPANAGDTKDPGAAPGLGKSPGEGKGYPLQYSSLENSVGKAMGVTKSGTRLNDFHFHFFTSSKLACLYKLYSLLNLYCLAWAWQIIAVHWMNELVST